VEQTRNECTYFGGALSGPAIQRRPGPRSEKTPPRQHELTARMTFVPDTTRHQFMIDYPMSGPAAR
jgi:hypothetical protein